MDCSLPGTSVHGDSPGKSTGVSCHALFQGILSTQGLNPGLLHCRWILYHLSYQRRIYISAIMKKATSYINIYHICYWFLFIAFWASLVAQMVKRLPAMRETRVWSLGWEDLLEKEMATHSSILAWRIPWTEEPGRLQSMGLQRVGHDWVTSLFFSVPVFSLPLFLCLCSFNWSILWNSIFLFFLSIIIILL